MKKALIFGVSGQDGAYLSRFLLSKGYEVHGTSRKIEPESFRNLDLLGIGDKVKITSVNTQDFSSVLKIIEAISPDEIYNLAGQSSVARSFTHPVETIESVVIGTMNLLEAIRILEFSIKFYNASSAECYGNRDKPSNELTLFSPNSPYAVAKAGSFWQTVTYRDSYNLFVCNGILFNHESPLRPEGFVTQKIVAAACRIANGSNEKLKLGNISIIRDWGYAPDYVEAMWLMLQQESPNDFVIATGQSHTLEEFVNAAFSTLGIDWKKFVDLDKSLFRPTDIIFSRADPMKSFSMLGWRASHSMFDVVKIMIESKIKN